MPKYKNKILPQEEQGLKRRPTYEEMINESLKPNEYIREPNREASLIRRSFYMTQFDGTDAFENMMEDQVNIQKEQARQHELQNIARESKTNLNVLTHKENIKTKKPRMEVSDSLIKEEQIQAEMDDEEKQQEELEKSILEANKGIKEQVKKELKPILGEEIQPPRKQEISVASSSSNPPQEKDSFLFGIQAEDTKEKKQQKGKITKEVKDINIKEEYASMKIDQLEKILIEKYQLKDEVNKIKKLSQGRKRKLVLLLAQFKPDIRILSDSQLRELLKENNIPYTSRTSNLELYELSKQIGGSK